MSPLTIQGGREQLKLKDVADKHGSLQASLALDSRAAQLCLEGRCPVMYSSVKVTHSLPLAQGSFSVWGLHSQGHLLPGQRSCGLSMVLGEQGPHLVFGNGREVT